MSAAKLYTPELLGLAVELAGHPFDETLEQMGEARSQSCGSTLALGLALDGEGRVTRMGLRVRACAVGQASAAIFARHAAGYSAADIKAAREAIRRWLAEIDNAAAELPDWPDLALIAPARGFAGRHGAIMLAWDAALSALSTASPPR